jgi:hypothetical protein
MRGATATVAHRASVISAIAARAYWTWHRVPSHPHMSHVRGGLLLLLVVLRHHLRDRLHHAPSASAHHQHASAAATIHAAGSGGALRRQLRPSRKLHTHPLLWLLEVKNVALQRVQCARRLLWGVEVDEAEAPRPVLPRDKAEAAVAVERAEDVRGLALRCVFGYAFDEQGDELGSPGAANRPSSVGPKARGGPATHPPHGPTHSTTATKAGRPSSSIVTGALFSRASREVDRHGRRSCVYTQKPRQGILRCRSICDTRKLDESDRVPDCTRRRRDGACVHTHQPCHVRRALTLSLSNAACLETGHSTECSFDDL